MKNYGLTKKMMHPLHLISILFFIISFSAPAQDSDQEVHLLPLIPKPAYIQMQPGAFQLSEKTVIVIDDDNMKADGEVFNAMLSKIYGTELRIIRADAPMVSSIILTYTESPDIEEDSYELNIRKNRITIFGKGAGVFYGFQTLLQLIRQNSDLSLFIPCCEIKDEPRYSWRGMHLDVSRHFFPKEFIKKYIDLMALYKMNTFHWHLTDDQGWRIEIKKYPLLTKVGAWRNGSMIGDYKAMQFDSIRYGGFYSQDDIREIVSYATKRHVTIVPEIEMPGHSMAALASYPGLSCTGGPFEAGKSWGVYDDVFCPKEETFRFLKNVLSEVCTLFPGEYIHIGGDECPKIRWKNCSHCQALMKKLKLKDENQLQRYFTNRIGKILKSKGKRFIGWDEILEKGLHQDAAIMSWRGTEGGIAAAKQKHSVVMTPGGFCYFDHYQGSPQHEPLAIGGYTTVEKVYSYEPAPPVLQMEEEKYILGAQGNVWTEYILTPDHVEYMALPRMCALAEVLWIPKGQKEYPDFQNRLLSHFSLLDKLGVNYAKSIYELKLVVNSSSVQNELLVELVVPFDKGKIVYTLDGSDPTMNSTKYSGPVRINGNCKIKAAYFEGDKQKNRTLSQDFYFSKSTGKKITLDTLPDEKYYCNGAASLVDGIKGDLFKHGQNWLGWRGHDMVATIDLSEMKTFAKVSMAVFDDEPAWIYLPVSIEVLTSNDGKDFTTVRKMSRLEIINSNKVVDIRFEKQEARYVMIIARNAGIIPEGKQGSGNYSWLFVDEISIE